MRKHQGTVLKTVAVVAALFIIGPLATADVITFSASGAGIGLNLLAAEAIFEVDGNTLTVILTNTSEAVTEIRAELLTGVYFDIGPDVTLETVSAVLAAGSVVVGETTTGDLTGPNGEVGGEFAFRDDLSFGFNDAQYGISSSGMDDVFGGHDLFPGQNLDTRDLDSPLSPDGPNYGILSDGGLGPNHTFDSPHGLLPMIDNSVVFTFNITSGSFGVDDIGNVSFQYGTSMSEPNLPVPEPATYLLMGIGLVGFLARKRIFV